MLPPLKNTRDFVEALRSDPQAKLAWGPAWMGYFFLSLAEGSGGIVSNLETWSPQAALLYSFSMAFTIGAATHALGIGGLWLAGGARIVGGKQGFYKTIKLAGYVFFWPGLLIVPAFLVEIFTMGQAGGALAAIGFLALLWHIAIGMWGWFRTVNAVRHFHQLSLGKAVFIALWLPVLVMAIVVLVTYLF